MAAPFSNTHLRVPQGFGAMLEGLTREILRDQPEDIPKYAAQYFETLLKKRDESNMDHSEGAAKLEDSVYNNHAFKSSEEECSGPQKKDIMDIPLHDPEANRAAAKIQDDAHGYMTPKKLKLEDKEVSGQPQKKGIMDIPLDDPEANKAAATIQAGVRGYVTRKKLKPEDEAEVEETGPSKETATEVTISKENSFEPRTEDESSDSEEEQTDKEESLNRFPIAGAQSDEPGDTVEEHNPAITVVDEVDKAANEMDSSSVPDQNIPQSEFELGDFSSYRGLSNVDVCAQELGAAEDEEGNKRGPALVDEELVDSGEEDNTEVAEQVEIMLYSGPADVDVCAAELGGTERTMKGVTAEDVTHVTEKEEDLKRQPEDILVESLMPQTEIMENDQQEAVDPPENAKEERTETESYSGETHESLAHSKGSLDGNVIPKEGSLTEISFEYVPEAQQISEIVAKQPDEHSLIEALQMDILEMREMGESEELTTGQYIADAQDHHKHQMESIEKVNGAKWTDDLTLSDGDEREKGENISSLNQHSTGTEKENQEHETNRITENNEKLSEITFLKNEDLEKTTPSDDPDFKKGHMTDMVGGDNEETHEEGYSETKDQEINNGRAENNSSQVTQSNTSMARMGAESEVFEESVQHQQEENERSQRTLVWLQPEDTVEEKEVTSKEEEELRQGMTDSEIQEKSDTMQEEENISLPHSADWTADEQQEEDGLLELEEDTSVPPESADKEECSRPQEEEDIMDIPLDDPEANRAAAKIQAGFRGHMTRKKLKPEDKTEGEERQEDRGQ